MPPEDRIKERQFKSATGSALRFTAIEGIGEKTARKLDRVRGIDAPKDAADYSTDELADAADISESRARKAIKGGGGNPAFSDTGGPSSVGAGNIAESLRESQQQSAQTVMGIGETKTFAGLEAAAENVERQDAISQSKKAEKSEITDAPTEDLITFGQVADSVSDATADPVDPTQDPPIEVADETRERVSKGAVAARRELGGRGFDRDEITNHFSEQPEGGFSGGLFSGFFGGSPDDVDDIDREEFGRARQFNQERSAKARRVDGRRDAPVTDEITTWKSDPSHFDYPGVDTPEANDGDFQLFNNG